MTLLQGLALLSQGSASALGLLRALEKAQNLPAY